MRPRPSPSPAGRVEPSRLEVHVRRLCEDFSPRDETHPQNLDRAAAYIFQQLRKAGGEVEDQPFEVNGTIYRNVVARFGPPTRECVVIGAHYDAAGPFPGADDNASAVAGLLELGSLLGRAERRRRVELVAFTLEEPPWFGSPAMGSAVHVASLKERGLSLRAMIGLEMIGYFSDAPGSQGFPLSILRLFYPSRGNFIAVVGKLGQGSLVRRVRRAMRRASPLPVHSITAPRSLPGIELSDHRNYWNAGYDAVMITDTAFFRNPNYHTALDTPETLDYARMAMVVEGVFAAVVAEEG